MPVGQPMPLVARYTCTILTCDPTTTPPTIEAQLKGADARPVSVVGIPAAWRWPEVGEIWVVRQENGSWYLESRVPDSSDAVPVSSLGVGEMRLDATAIVNAAGNALMARGDAAGGALTGTYPNPSLVKPTWTAVNGYFTGSGTGNWQDYSPGSWPVLQYCTDSFGFVRLRGTVKNGTAVAYPSTNVLIATLPAAIRPSTYVRVNAAFLDTGTGRGIPYVYIDHTTGVLQMGGLDFGTSTANNGSYAPLWVEATWMPNT